MNKKLRKKFNKIAKANLAVGLVVASLLLNTATELYAKDDEIIFINSSVIRTEEFEKSLPHHAEIVYLDKNRSGIGQITEYLARKEDVDAVRIISHGNSGYFVLNGEVIDNKFIAENEQPISTWKDALSEDADIMLYGCKLAATAEGKDFVKQLAKLTGADVAAATEEIGGQLANWTLDYKSGDIETTTLRIDNYVFHLANQLVTDNGNSGVGSLRQAIVEAGDGDEITFNLSSGNEAITILEDLDITESLTIDGDNISGSGTNVTVQVETPGLSGSAWRVFNINASDKDINLSNMTIKGGDLSSLPTGEDALGGGIYLKSGTLNISSCSISGATSLHGGGIYNKGTIELISNSIISGNTADGDGGGIHNDYGTITTISNSTISGNTAGYAGGGIFNYHSIITTISNSTISGNISDGNGAGINNYYGTITLISNSTISGNTTTNDQGGGIYNYGTITSISSSTISGNTAEYGGGGIWNGYFYSYINSIKNSIIAGNTSIDTDDARDIFTDAPITAVIDGGWNIIGESSRFTDYGYNTGVDINANTITGVQANLFGTGLATQTLADNGGSTQTLALSAGSVAVDEGTASGPPLTDQRGESRVGGTDIGAYEWEGYVWDGSEGTVWAIGDNWNSGLKPTTQDVYIPDVSNDPIIASNGTADCNDLTINSGATLTLEDGGSLITAGTVTNNGTFNAERSISNGQWHLISSPISDALSGMFIGDFLQTWSETSATWSDIPALDTPLSAGKGFGFWSTDGTTTHIFTGTPNTGDKPITITISGSGGEYNKANLIGNPYPSSIDWNLVGGYGAKYTYNGTGYDAYIAVDGYGTGSRYTAPAQGFFILPASSGTFTFTNSMRTHEGADGFVKASNTISNGLILAASCDSYEDKLFIVFNENGSSNFELEKDAYKILGNTDGVSELYSISDNTKFAVDIRPETELIQLGFQNNQNGAYTIGLKEIDGITHAELEDTKLNTFHNLSNGAYSFDWNTNDSEERFILHLKATGTQELVEQEAQVYSNNGQIYIRQTSSMLFQSVQIFDLAGRVIYSGNLNQTEIQSIHLSNSKGAYLVQLNGDKMSQTKKVILN